MSEPASTSASDAVIRKGIALGSRQGDRSNSARKSSQSSVRSALGKRQARPATPSSVTPEQVHAMAEIMRVRWLDTNPTTDQERARVAVSAVLDFLGIKTKEKPDE